MKRFLADIQTHEIPLYQITDTYLQACAVRETRRDIDLSALQAYLDKACYIEILLDLGKCIFDNQSITSNETLLTDGNWIWSGDLNHYSLLHHFAWPEAFITSVQKRSYKPKRITGRQKNEIAHLANEISRKVYGEQFTTVYPNGKDETVYAERTYVVTALDTLI
ncbi:hypothetical protein [Taibaiella chishuiensis]|uniref:Uncharacterized protein n=1 Tax=Taibaiella chishuiensis TaxID=1434707 RepID=A0A2P8D7B4_9BACT|nr:hypothetical protein [Taibaiella chishuiensis]PSK93098.1 hypothetical protein B0I18_10267 [Taibaiella chishuiensis]